MPSPIHPHLKRAKANMRGEVPRRVGKKACRWFGNIWNSFAFRNGISRSTVSTILLDDTVTKWADRSGFNMISRIQQQCQPNQQNLREIGSRPLRSPNLRPKHRGHIPPTFPSLSLLSDHFFVVPVNLPRCASSYTTIYEFLSAVLLAVSFVFDRKRGHCCRRLRCSTASGKAIWWEPKWLVVVRMKWKRRWVRLES